MNSTILTIVRECGAHGCIECGKCSAACSMPSMYPDFSADSSPRGFVQHALRQAAGRETSLDETLLWHCLQCGNCSLACPEQVDCARLIAMLRAMATVAQRRTCAVCDRELPALPVRNWLQDTLEPDSPLKAFDDENDHASANRVAVSDLCSVCRRQAYAANNVAG